MLSYNKHYRKSSRPYAWNSKLDNALIQELLPYEPRVDVAASDIEDEIEDEDLALELEPDAPQSSPLKLFRLSPLDPDDIALFVGRRGIVDTNAFIDALERAALFDLAQLPSSLMPVGAFARLSTGRAPRSAGRLERLLTVPGSLTRKLKATGAMSFS